MQTGVVDLVLSPAEIPNALVAHARRLDAAPRGDGAVAEGSAAPVEEAMDRVFELLRAAYGIDFTHYKPTTVLRRIERRLAIVSASSL